jgi:hypothetical protein
MSMIEKEFNKYIDRNIYTNIDILDYSLEYIEESINILDIYQDIIKEDSIYNIRSNIITEDTNKDKNIIQKIIDKIIQFFKWVFKQAQTLFNMIKNKIMELLKLKSKGKNQLGNTKIRDIQGFVIIFKEDISKYVSTNIDISSFEKNTNHAQSLYDEFSSIDKKSEEIPNELIDKFKENGDNIIDSFKSITEPMKELIESSDKLQNSNITIAKAGYTSILEGKSEEVFRNIIKRYQSVYNVFNNFIKIYQSILDYFKYTNISNNTVIKKFLNIINSTVKQIHTYNQDLNQGMLEMLNSTHRIINFMNHSESLEHDGKAGMKIHLMQTITNRDIRKLRIILANGIAINHRNPDIVKGEVDTILSNGISENELFQPHEDGAGKYAMTDDKSKWDYDYYDTQQTQSSFNFSRKRLEHLIEVYKYIRKIKDKK